MDTDSRVLELLMRLSVYNCTCVMERQLLATNDDRDTFYSVDLR